MQLKASTLFIKKLEQNAFSMAQTHSCVNETFCDSVVDLILFLIPPMTH